MSFQEWPKWVNGRPAGDAAEALLLLSHQPSCGIHATEIVEQAPPKQPLLRPRHPEHELKCSCGGITPSGAALKAAGIDPLDHDASGRKGGSKPKNRA